MDTNRSALARLTDEQLLLEVKRLAACECRATAALIASLCEVDVRKLYLREGYSSLFTYCTTTLRLSESAAYFRIEAARAAARFPLVLERLAEGAVTLTAVKMLAPHLTAENCRELLDAARGASKAAIEELVARLRPLPDVPAIVRKLPPPVGARDGAVEGCRRDERRGASSAAVDAQATWAGTGTMGDAHADGGRERLVSAGQSTAVRPAAHESATDQAPRPVGQAPVAAMSVAATGVGVVRPPLAPHDLSKRPPGVVTALAPGRYKVQVTVSAETHAKLRRAQDLMRHSSPDGDLALILDRALTLLVERLERTQHAALKRRQAGKVANRPAPKATNDPARRAPAPTAEDAVTSGGEHGVRGRAEGGAVAMRESRLREWTGRTAHAVTAQQRVLEPVVLLSRNEAGMSLRTSCPATTSPGASTSSVVRQEPAPKRKTKSSVAGEFRRHRPCRPPETRGA